jgi:protein-tyrosine phosphatase
MYSKEYCPHIAEIDTNLFFGSKFSTHKKVLEDFSIDNVFLIGCKIKEKISNVKYDFFDIEENINGLDTIKKIGQKICNKIDILLENKKNVLICCQLGRNLSVFIIIMYLHHKYSHMTYYDIITKIKSVRNIGINIIFENFLVKNWNNL